jgi:hypothetical protein
MKKHLKYLMIIFYLINNNYPSDNDPVKKSLKEQTEKFGVPILPYWKKDSRTLKSYIEIGLNLLARNKRIASLQDPDTYSPFL